MVDEPQYTITGTDPATGERVTDQLSAAEAERIVILGDGLPDPDDVGDEDDD